MQFDVLRYCKRLLEDRRPSKMFDYLLYSETTRLAISEKSGFDDTDSIADFLTYYRELAACPNPVMSVRTGLGLNPKVATGIHNFLQKIFLEAEEEK